YRKELKRRKNKEISFSELPDITVESLATWDDYETNYTIFNVCGIDIKVLDDELAEALKQLPEKKRNNVLMYYFLEMSDTEIADIMNYTRGAVFKHRHRALETMKEILKEKK
ncbi:RNA polymerase subunit sigma, partial [Clostridioides difficile]